MENLNSDFEGLVAKVLIEWNEELYDRFSTTLEAAGVTPTDQAADDFNEMVLEQGCDGETMLR